MVTCPGCDAKTFIPGDLPPLATEPCKKCGHSIMMPMQLRQFELRAKVGSGGMATVYRAWDTMLERFVAVKLMKKEILAEPNALENFAREARACAKLNHTNIIHIYTFDEWEGETYLVMELADQGSLDTRIERLRIVDELKVLDVGIKIAEALDLALKHDMLHCDIKPGNILFNTDQEPKLVDFGLARKTDAGGGNRRVYARHAVLRRAGKNQARAGNLFVRHVFPRRDVVSRRHRPRAL